MLSFVFRRIGFAEYFKKIDKDITTEQILNSARQCLKHSIIPQYSFMVGLPGEKREDADQTIDLIDALLKLDPRVQILGPQAFRPYRVPHCIRNVSRWAGRSPKNSGIGLTRL